VGTFEAVEGVTVSAELPGKVTQILFEPGTAVDKGAPLLVQDVTSEEAQLREAEASVALARINLNRIRKLLDTKAVSQSDFDTADAQLKQAIARSDNIRSMIAKKNIRAPFAGRLGIRQVNLGQDLREGDAIVTIQSLHPIFVNFSLPQQQYVNVKPGLIVQITTDALPDKVLEGRITAISPVVDSATRNIQLQATVNNADKQLLPGMFAKVGVVLPTQNEVTVIPATAVLHAPYGDSVFVIESQQGEENSGEKKMLRQQFVRLGESRGDYVAVTSGLKEKEMIVSSGVFKLRNGQAVVVDNKLAPAFELEPQPDDS
jgi:membrane fusion protein (multidrug efflux system)